MSEGNLKGKVFIHLFFILMCIVYIIPFALVVSISFSTQKDIIANGYSIIPQHFTLSAYKYILNNPDTLIGAYKVTVFTTVFGTVLSVFLMALIAYPLSKKSFNGRKFVSFYIFFTMLFNGGLVPTYILVTQYLHLGDTIWVFILPSLINAWFVFLIRTFFSQLPEAIAESALLDGASEFRIFITMTIPLSKPVLATVALMGAIGRWNDWYTAMLYINNEKLLTLQYLLQRMIQDIKLIQQQGAGSIDVNLMSQGEVPTESIQMAMAIIAAGPMLVVLPFFQKYFVKGLTVGSVKG